METRCFRATSRVRIRTTGKREGGLVSPDREKRRVAAGPSERMQGGGGRAMTRRRGEKEKERHGSRIVFAKYQYLRPPCWYLCSDCDLTRLNSTDPAATRLPLPSFSRIPSSLRITLPEKLLSPSSLPLLSNRRRKVPGFEGRESTRLAGEKKRKKEKKQGGKPLRQARLISGVYADRNVARLASRPRGTEEREQRARRGGWSELYYAVCCDCRWCRHIAGRVRCNK